MACRRIQNLRHDVLAASLVPDDVPVADRFPVSVYGDGNCLYRAASVAMSGTEDDHVELSARTVLECEVLRSEGYRSGRWSEVHRDWEASVLSGCNAGSDAKFDSDF